MVEPWNHRGREAIQVTFQAEANFKKAAHATPRADGMWCRQPRRGRPRQTRSAAVLEERNLLGGASGSWGICGAKEGVGGKSLYRSRACTRLPAAHCVEVEVTSSEPSMARSASSGASRELAAREEVIRQAVQIMADQLLRERP